MPVTPGIKERKHLETIRTVSAERGANMTVSERNARIAYLLKRKEALTWKWIGACEEINAQIETLRATPTEEEDGTDQTAEAQVRT